MEKTKPTINFFEIDSEVISRLVFGKPATAEIDLSIVIPTYKRVHLLRKNLRSLVRQKKADNVHYEIIIVSNDWNFDYQKLDMYLNPEIFNIYVNEQNLGMCGNMNRCAQLARGKYIAYIQDDDILLPEYLVEFQKLYQSGQLKNVDCLIPNRFFLMPDREKESQFGKRAIRNMRIKQGMCKILRFGKPIPKMQKIMPYESMITTYPFYAGGPTCGMLFKQKSLISSGGFNPAYPYGFDYMFFMNYSEVRNVFLFDKFLAVYMTSDSASNRPEVQYDFFRARYIYLLENFKKHKIPEKVKDIIVYSTYKGYSKAVREFIDKEFNIQKVPKLICKGYMQWARLNVYRHGGYRRKACPHKIIRWYEKM